MQTQILCNTSTALFFWLQQKVVVNIYYFPYSILDDDE